MLKLFAYALGCAMVAGCVSQVPIPVSAPISNQAKARAVHHWDLLARDVASQVSGAMQRDPSLARRTIHVSPAKVKSDFNRAFTELLITRLVNEGLAVSSERGGAVELSIDTQVVVHKSERFAYRPGTLLSLAAGLIVLRGLDWSNPPDRVVGVLGLAGGADYALSTYAGGPTKTELIVTASILDGGQYRMRKADVYYIEDVDASLFLTLPVAAPLPVRNVEVRGGS